jgi:cytochrome c553
MTQDRTPSGWKSLTAAAAAIVAGVAFVAAGLGFVVLPLLEPNSNDLSIWQRICHAAGISSPAAAGQPIAPAMGATSGVTVVPGMLNGLPAAAIGHGATLALQCGSCHGARGVSGANVPNLAGQYPAAIYKELADYASGARVNAVMGPRVAQLSDTDMRDLAAFYAYLPRLPDEHSMGSGAAPSVVASGSPMQNIAPCGACHGGAFYKTGSPSLEGEPSAYLRAQLVAFAHGTRHNDISAQMRNVARGMSQAQIDAAVDYYSGPS